MEIKFFSKGKILDLSGQKISVSESNSKLSDKMLTKYLFPFDFYMDDEFKATFGDYSAFDSYDLPKTIEGKLLYENVYSDAVFNIIGNEGDFLNGQIDFGFEEIPNFDKALKDLPLETYKVENIHTFAAEICKKVYPQTNFNFPRLYYNRYSPEDKTWDAYNGYVNDLNGNGSAMRNNYIDNDGEIYNVNIIHPCPHLLYLLKLGFSDGGTTLEGDILEDEFLKKQYVFSGTEYFSRKIQRRYGFEFTSEGADQIFIESGPDDYAEYHKYNTIAKIGTYKIAGIIEYFKASKMIARYSLALNKTVIWSKNGGSSNGTSFEQIPLNIQFEVTTPDSILEFYIYTQYHPKWKHQMSSLSVTSLFLDDNSSEGEQDGEGVITNLNEIDLSRAVPDITFGELVNRIRNFLNYEITSSGNTIYMNKIKRADPSNIKIIPEEFLEIKPRRNLINKKSFLLKQPDWENDEKSDSIYYDTTGVFTNKEAGELTIVIESNIYAIPVLVAKAQGHETGVIKSYSSNLLQLVKYEGKTGIQNNAKASPELTFPALFYTNWESYLRGRLRSSEFIWSFTASKSGIGFGINDEIAGYQNIHIIKEWVKDFSENSVTVSITTETIN